MMHSTKQPVCVLQHLPTSNRDALRIPGMQTQYRTAYSILPPSGTFSKHPTELQGLYASLCAPQHQRAPHRLTPEGSTLVEHISSEHLRTRYRLSCVGL